MYTQHPRRANIPENYSGNAFRYPPIGSLAVPSDESEEGSFVPLRSSPTTRQDDGVPREAEITEQREERMREPSAVQGEDALPTDTSQGSSGLGRENEKGHSLLSLPFLNGGHGIGSEELLLIGLFLLLTGGDNEDGNDREKGDLLFYLLLLFFCG